MIYFAKSYKINNNKLNRRNAHEASVLITLLFVFIAKYMVVNECYNLGLYRLRKTRINVRLRLVSVAKMVM